MMVINEKPIFNKCLIKFNKTYERNNETGEKLLENKKKPIIKNLEKNNKVHLEELDDNEEDKAKESVLDNIVDSSTNTVGRRRRRKRNRRSTRNTRRTRSIRSTRSTTSTRSTRRTRRTKKIQKTTMLKKKN